MFEACRSALLMINHRVKMLRVAPVSLAIHRVVETILENGRRVDTLALAKFT